MAPVELILPFAYYKISNIYWSIDQWYHGSNATINIKADATKLSISYDVAYSKYSKCYDYGYKRQPQLRFN